jgi:hypothetical protein
MEMAAALRLPDPGFGDPTNYTLVLFIQLCSRLVLDSRIDDASIDQRHCLFRSRLAERSLHFEQLQLDLLQFSQQL